MPLAFSIDQLPTLLKEALPPCQALVLDRVAGAAATLHMPVFVVGGTLRDLLLGRPAGDLDIAVEGDAHRLASALVGPGERPLLHHAFGTATVTLDGEQFDLVTARHETYARPGSLPEVTPDGIQADLWRRDFSVNALAARLWPPPAGALIDPTGGLDDLRRGVLRVLHPGSFRDDPTRLFRAARYARRLAFRLEHGTRLLARQDARYVPAITGQRLAHELDLVLAEPRAGAILQLLDHLGALASLPWPLVVGPRFDRLLRRARGLIETDNVAVARRRELAWSTLSADLGMDGRQEIVARLALPSSLAQAARTLNRLHEDEVELGQPGLPPSRACRLLSGLAPEALAVGGIVAPSPVVRHRLRRYLQSWRWVAPSLRAVDLMALGIPEGPPIGRALRLLLAARLDQRLHTVTGERRLIARWQRQGMPETG
ncbi:MAG: CCA tRNA nucleotidyltransferase [Chloroflexi bacterium]|nr:CCA tRNA nucleotidyltransferase [Chloroflexota bacterium]